MQCKHCGAEVTGNFCPQCGEPADPLLHQCPVCSKEREENELFCTKCGYRFGKEQKLAPIQEIKPAAAAMQPAETGAQPAIGVQPQAAAQPTQAAEAAVQPKNQNEHAAEKQPASGECAYVHIRRYERIKRWLAFFTFAALFFIISPMIYYNSFLFLFEIPFLYPYRNYVIIIFTIILLGLLCFSFAPLKKWNPKKIKNSGSICLAVLTAFAFICVLTDIFHTKGLVLNLYEYFHLFLVILLLSILFINIIYYAKNMTRKMNLLFYGTEKVTKDTPLLPQYDPFDFEKIKQEYAELRGKKTVQADDGAYGSSRAPSTAPAGAAGAAPSFGHIALYDTIVHKKDWKRFRKHATQAELAVLAIGSRSRLTGPRFFIKSVIAVAGMILSIVFGLAYTFSEYMQFGLILLIGGYLFFNLLASKQIGYSDTYSSCYGKLSGEYSKMVKELFKEHIALTILRQIILIFLRIITIPYQFILMIIETLIPPAANWTVAHGGNAGAVITLPKGYNIGNLAALGEYYASSTFGAAWEEHMENTEAARLAKFSQYEYFDKNGMRQTAYSDDGRTFYTSTDKLQEVGTSDDGGKTIELK